MTAAVAISASALTVALLALLATLLQRKTLRTLAQQVKYLETKLPEQKPLDSATSRFSAHLHDAEQTQHKSQQELKERLQENNRVKPQQQADKYRYAVALAAQGQTVDSIAQALNMAPAEVEQVMRLARVKRPA